MALSLAKINEAMFGAAEAGDLAKVEDMLAQGAQPDEFKSDRGFTALTAVCANGDDGHADTDGRDHSGAGRDKENFLDRVFALPEAILGPILEGGRQCSCFKMGADENSLLAQRRL